MRRHVAPLVGAWIEIIDWLSFTVLDNVAPLVGAWIEIRMSDIMLRVYDVAPLVGAWIEIFYNLCVMQSHLCRSSCRSVD